MDVVASRVCDEMTRALERDQLPGLYLVATPIGNLADITLRALAVLSRADVIYAEDTRHSLRLLAHYGISHVIALKSYHEHNAARRRPVIIAALERGERVALISDAGMPLVSDPGFKLVREVVEAGHPVFCIPGPSACLAALSSSGLPTDAFLFSGFLPSKAGARQARLRALKPVEATLIFYEAPSRVGALIGELREVFGERRAVVARELTKLHEEVMRGSLDELMRRLEGVSLKGECVVLVGPPASRHIRDEDIIARLTSCLQDMSLRDGAREVAFELDVAKSRVYELGLKLKNKKS